jgi:GAF domain-containing protein
VLARLEWDEWAAVAAALVQLAGLPVTGTDRQRLLGEVAVLCRRAVPAASCASVIVGSPLEPTGMGSDCTQAQAFDGRQLQAQEGPGADAFCTGVAVSTPDVTTDPRWPALARLAGASPIRGVLTVPLGAADPTGVLGLYCAEPDGFGPAGRRAAELLAAAVGGVLHNVAEGESLRALAANLRCALSSRADIDQAKGVLMARFGVDAEGAFALLVTVSNRLNVKVRVLAGLVVQGRADHLLAAAGAEARVSGRPTMG